MSTTDSEKWLDSDRGEYVCAWERRKLDQAVADIFGYYAVQLGMPSCDFLRANRMPTRIRSEIDFRCDAPALPFASDSVDLAVLPHVLEFSADPHQVVREAARILRPEGQLLVLGFNPYSLWGLRNRHAMSRFAAEPADFPWGGRYISVHRLKDWLALLGFEISGGSFGCYAPPFGNSAWLRRFAFMEAAGDRWWAIGGGVYFLQAVKRVHGMRLILPKWRDEAAKAKSLVPIAQRNNEGCVKQ